MLYRVLGAAFLGYGGIIGWLYAVQRRLLYHPDKRRPQLGDLATLGVREVRLTTADGVALLGWYLPARPGRPVVVHFHGNGGHIGYRADRVLHFAREGFGMLLPEYRGYGGNPGEPTEAGLYADAEAAVGFLAAEGVAAARVVLWGESLGSAVAVAMASRHPVGCVVLEAPLTSVAAVAQHHYPFVPAAALVRDRFDALSRIDRVRAPLLFLHGGRDRVIPPRFGRELFAAAHSPKEQWFAPAANHGNLIRFGALDAATDFAERWLEHEVGTAGALTADAAGNA